MRRSKVQLVHDILSAVQQKGGRIKPTHLLYKANLSHEAMKQYVGDLLRQGMLVETHEREGSRYALTDQGFRFLSEYKKFSEFAESFGLGPET